MILTYVSINSIRNIIKFFWKKSITIYNGYDFSEIKKINKMAKDSNEKRFLFVGRLDEQKDPLTLIKAFELIEKNILMYI